jgi:hypothetical protein
MNLIIYMIASVTLGWFIGYKIGFYQGEELGFTRGWHRGINTGRRSFEGKF